MVIFHKIRKRKTGRKAYSNLKPKNFDKTLFVLTLSLTLIGLIAVADVSAPLALEIFFDRFYFVKQQIIWGFLGLVLLFISSRIHYIFWKKLSFLMFLVSILLLVAVLIPGIGTKALGARRWISFGFASLQPAELVKLTMAVYMAKILDDQNAKFLKNLLPVFIISALIMLQPDLGTTIVVVFIVFVQLFISGANLAYLSTLGVVGGFLGFLLIIISDYRKQRFLSYIKALVDPLKHSYHLKQILLALGSGGIFGVGLGQSRQKYLFLPEVATDSVFAVIAEEIGFVGAAIIIIALTVFVFRIVVISQNSPDRFSTLLSAGIAAWIGGQIFLNLGSIVALTPLTGIPLPFFSYGGSSLTMILIAIGILLNISRYGKTK